MKSNISTKLLLVVGLSISCLSAEVLNFSKAYEMAIENAHDIKSSAYLSKSDKEKITQEESQLYPQINLSAYYKKTDYVANPTKSKTKQGLLNYSLSFKQSVYNPELYSRIDIQKAKSDYSQTRVDLEKEELAQKVFVAYLDLLISSNKIEMFESYLEYNKYKLKELTKKYEMQLLNKMDLLEMKVEYHSAKIALKKEKKFFDLYNLKLKQLIGNIEYEMPSIDSNDSVIDMINLMNDKIAKGGESLRVKQAQVALQISSKEVENARDGHMPKVNFDASYAKYDTDDPTIDSPYNNVKSVMLTLNVPIYSGGYVSSKVAASKYMRQATNEDLLSIKKQVEVEYDEYLARYETSTDSVSMYKEALDSAKLYVDAISQGYDHGLKSISDLNEAKNKLYEVKQKYIENIYEMVNSYIGLLIINNNVEDVTLLDSLVD